MVEYVRTNEGCFLQAPVSPGGKALDGIRSAAMPAAENEEVHRKAASG